jgi:hypothetical protein
LLPGRFEDTDFTVVEILSSHGGQNRIAAEQKQPNQEENDSALIRDEKIPQ